MVTSVLMLLTLLGPMEQGPRELTVPDESQINTTTGRIRRYRHPGEPD